MDRKKRALWLVCLNAAAACFIALFLLVYLPRAQEKTVLPACLFERWLHLYCPGCGASRALAALAEGRLKESFLSNPLVLEGMSVLILFDFFTVASFCGGSVQAWKRRRRKALTVVCFIVAATILWLLVGRNLLLTLGHYDYLGDLVLFWD